MSFNTTDYDYEDLFREQRKQNEYLNTIRILYVCGYIIICILGLVLNLFVIIAGSCYHKSDTAKWVSALALTHLILSAFLPLQFLYSWFHFNWHYGTALCKISSYVFYASLFSTACIMTLWGVTDGIRRNTCQGTRCTIFRHSSAVLIMILCSWTLAAILSLPSLYSRELRYTVLGEQCIDDYDLDDEKTTEDGKRNLAVVACFRFILGILVPAFLIGICYCCQNSVMEKKLKQITCMIKLSYFVCWSPLLFMGFLQAFNYVFESHSYGLPVATVLAAAHCCVNPVIYLLVSRDFKMQWMKTQDQRRSLYI